MQIGKRSLYRWLWSEAGSQPGIEATLNVGMSPAVFAVSGDDGNVNGATAAVGAAGPFDCSPRPPSRRPPITITIAIVTVMASSS